VRAAYSGHDADVRRVPCYYANIPGRSVEPCIEVKTDDWSHHPHILRQSKAKHHESMITLTLGAGVQLDLTGESIRRSISTRGSSRRRPEPPLDLRRHS